VRLFFLNGGSECYVVNILDDATKATATIPGIPSEIMKFEAKSRGREGHLISVEIADSNTSNNTFSVVVRYDNVVKERFTECVITGRAPNYDIDKLSNSDYVSCNVNTNLLPSNGTFPLDGARDTQLPSYSETRTLYKAAINSLDAVDVFNLLVITKLRNETASSKGMRDEDYSDILSEASKYCRERRAFLLIDPYEAWRGWEAPIDHATSNIYTLRGEVEKYYSAVYFPRLDLTEFDPVTKSSVTKKIGPAAAVAGIIAEVDSKRGVWKAPAGADAIIKGITGPDVPLNDEQNGVLNREAINCIRSFVHGTVCWGARTVGGYEDSEWKYVPVRRLALYIEETLYRETKWVVYEPNDEPTWARVRTSIGPFMRNLFNQGAFQGASPKEAFFVKCDKDTTTEYHRRLGILNIIVGFAPLKPAEFVIIQIQQKYPN